MASFVWTSDEADPCKGADKWEIGSATPKNIRPMPIPAENSMHNQEKRKILVFIFVSQADVTEFSQA